MGDGVANGSVIDFGALDRRPLRAADDGARRHGPVGRRLPASLILLSDVDVSVDAHLERARGDAERASTASSATARATRGRRRRHDRLDYLRRHVVKEAATGT